MKWTSFLKLGLVHHSEFEYTLIKTLDLIGLFMIIFVKKELVDKISNIDYDVVKLGAGG